MKIASLAASAVVIGLAGPALAGGYVGLGVTSPSKLELADSQPGQGFSADGRGWTLYGGYAIPVKTGALAVELGYRSYGLLYLNYMKYDGTTVSIAGRYDHRLSDGFVVFGRLGLHHTKTEDLDERGAIYTIEGNGALVGAGVEYHPPIQLAVDPAVYIDATYTRAALAPAGGSTPRSSSDLSYSLGIAVHF